MTHLKFFPPFFLSSFLIFCTLFFIPFHGWAQLSPGASFIQWTVPEECGTAIDIANGTERILGNPPMESASKKVFGEVLARDTGWLVKIQVTDGEQSYVRSVSVNTCTAVMELSALLTALAVDPVGVLRSEDPTLQAGIEKLNDLAAAKQKTPADTSDRSGQRQPTDSQEKTDKSPLETAESRNGEVGRIRIEVSGNLKPSHPSVTAGLALSADVGLTASFRPGFLLFGALRRKRALIEISVGYSPPATYSVQGSSDIAGWSSQVFTGVVGAGQLFSVRRVGLGWTLGVAGIGMWAESTNVEYPNKNRVWVAAAVLGGKLEWRFSDQGGLFFHPSGHFLLSRPKFSIDGIGVVQQPKRIVLVGAIGLFLKFGKQN